MIEWTPEEKQLRDELLDKLAYVTGELPGGRLSASCTLEVLSVLGKLGWGKLPTVPAAAPAPNLEEFRAYGDDYAGVTVTCRKCTEPNTPYKNQRAVRVGYLDLEGDNTVAKLVKICAEHVHQPAEGEPK